MIEQGIKFDKESPGIVRDEVEIRADFNMENLQYKFIVGSGGIWNAIQDFSEENTCKWKPVEEGKYMIMVQAKEIDSKKPYDYLAKERYIVDKIDKVKLIKDIEIENTNIISGEKIKINVISYEKILYRFWIQGKNDWELIRDYTKESKLIYTPIKEGKNEILIECKRIDSKESFDEFTTVSFDVLPHAKIEITDYKCICDEFIVNNEITFNVDVNLASKRNILYKFIKINEKGKAICIQDYSSKKVASYMEENAGRFRMLCLVKDILSNKEYDDRALMIYEVKPYKDINIKRLFTSLNSPQVNGTPIIIKADVDGGKELLYRYVIEGDIAEDSRYTRRNEYEWIPKKPGDYNISLYVKDISFDGEYEKKDDIKFKVQSRGERPAKIKNVVLDKKNTILVGESINLKVMAEGEFEIEYSFIVRKDNKEIERINFSEVNWVNFTPSEKGNYEVEILVKNKYSLKNYDSNTFVYLTAKEYLPAEIDCILVPNVNEYIVGDKIEIETVTENTKSILLRYVTNINGHMVEDTGFINSKKIDFMPRCSGKYTFEIYAKNIKCEEEFDCKKEIAFYVKDSLPIIATKVFPNKDDIKINREVTFTATSEGGKDVYYEFYLMEKGNWIKAQAYSKKNYYTFIPFIKGKYRILVLAKSYYKKVKYEDYGEFNFQI